MGPTACWSLPKGGSRGCRSAYSPNVTQTGGALTHMHLPQPSAGRSGGDYGRRDYRSDRRGGRDYDRDYDRRGGGGRDSGYGGGRDYDRGRGGRSRSRSPARRSRSPVRRVRSPSPDRVRSRSADRGRSPEQQWRGGEAGRSPERRGESPRDRSPEGRSPARRWARGYRGLGEYCAWASGTSIVHGRLGRLPCIQAPGV